MSQLPSLGAIIDLSEKPCIHVPNFIAGIRACFWSLDSLSALHIGWSGWYGDRKGRYLDGFGHIEWHTARNLISFSTRKIPQAFKAQAWTFEQQWTGILRELPEANSECPSRLIIARPPSANDNPIMVFLADDEDYHTFDDRLAVEGLASIAARVHPVYPSKPDGHALMDAHHYVATAWSEFADAIDPER